MTESNPIDSESPLWDVRGWKRLTIHEDPPVVAARKEFLAWLAEVPDPYSVDLNARLRSKLDHAHLSARLELFVHHYFRSNEWAVRIHPQVVESSNHPDFLVEKEGGKLLVECRSVFDHHIIEQQDQRLHRLADDVSKELGRTVILHPLSDLPPSIPARRIRSWINQQQIPDESSDLMEFDFWDDHQGIHYGVRAIMLKLNEEEKPPTGVQGFISQAQNITNAQQLRGALQEKASKYGTLNVPYVIAVSGETWSPMSTRHEVDALFGNRVWNIPQRGPVIVTETRNRDGFFTVQRNNVPRYGHVSAVLVYRFKWLEEGHDHRMHVYHNPFATRPINPELFPGFPQFIRQGETAMRWANGEPESY